MTTSAPTADPATAPLEVPPGLKGLVVAETALGDVRGGEGFYHYRQYDATELARLRSLEDVWHLVLDGQLPTPAQRAAFAAEVAPWRALAPEVAGALPALVAAAPGQPTGQLRTALSLVAAHAGMRPVVELDEPARRRDALRLGAAMPALVGTLLRLDRGLEPVAPRPELGHAAGLLWLLHAVEPVPAQVAALERYLVATIDHGFNASTFTARVIASTGADVGAALVGALGALSGPRHGGAPGMVLDMLDEIGSPERAAEVVRAHLAAGERIPGFGHAVYRTADPRSGLLAEAAAELGGPRVELAAAAEAAVLDVLAELRPDHDLQTNVEWWGGIVMEACGIPASLATSVFAVSRTLGWGAQLVEQARSSAIIRPSSRYVGPDAPVPVPPVAV